MQELVEHWQQSYDWRKHEAALNRFAHFKADIDGVGIHFIHERGKGPNPTPLLLIHGFPELVLSLPQGHRAAHRSGKIWRRPI